MMQNAYISLSYILAARTAGIDRNKEITSLSPNAGLYNAAARSNRIGIWEMPSN